MCRDDVQCVNDPTFFFLSFSCSAFSALCTPSPSSIHREHHLTYAKKNEQLWRPARTGDLQKDRFITQSFLSGSVKNHFQTKKWREGFLRDDFLSPRK
ncbi:neuronal regeneration-related protein isoform X1 [Bubalus bubalis]|uniref:neuronal regeneration-related protein isoform X1 n=1 Tax=Bubalus bubalis TaxID=89462 RepID=UPI001D10E287|nr:neuronal regeneration-related protein isoform X1 [Bubalus bubalis]